MLQDEKKVPSGMPDVTRSDSQRSDTSLRPRVSFNRDVHVKRIVPREGGRPTGALSGDGNGHLVASPVRKERINKSKQQLAEEAAQVLNQVDKLNCVSKPRGVSPEKFYTLPSRRKEKANYPTGSLDRKWPKRNSFELNSECPPKKPQRTFASEKQKSPVPPSPPKSLLSDLFKREKKKVNLRRSASDATNSKSKTFSDIRKDQVKNSPALSGEVNNSLRVQKKQLSPIIEVTPREDYFVQLMTGDNKENDDNNINVKKTVTEQLKEYIDEVDQALYHEGVNIKNSPTKKDDINKVVVIDVDKAEKISDSKKSKIKNSLLGKKFKSFASAGKKTNNRQIIVGDKQQPLLKVKKSEKVGKDKIPVPSLPLPPTSTRIKEAIEHLENQSISPPIMIHSSQKPVDKLPLTKGRTVDSMVRRLNSDISSPPPPPPIAMVVVPNASTQHNNNQPFSYTRGLSPEKFTSDENLANSTARPVIYAQVVCNNDGFGGGSSKQTIHTIAYGKKQPHSDSDEGLGNEENTAIRNKYRNGKTSITHFGDDVKMEKESPIMPKYRVLGSAYNNNYDDDKCPNRFAEKVFIDSSTRGRGDGMDSSKRRESLSEQVENEIEAVIRLNGRSDVSARRDLLESRINRRINDTGTLTRVYRSGSSSPKIPTLERHNNKQPSYNYDGVEPKSLDSQISDYRSSPENKFETSQQRRRYETSERTLRSKNMFKSTPDIYHYSNEHPSHQHSYHDSLKRDKHKFTKIKSEKDRFGDSGIENDIIRRDSGDNFVKRNYPDYCNDSEDEGFASSLLIASERQHTENNNNIMNNKKKNLDDFERVYSGEDEPYRNLEHLDYKVATRDYNEQEYVPRERNIDDGSHFDPRIDHKEFIKERTTLKRNEKKPPKHEKKSGLEKVKQLFSRDNKKKKSKQEMVHEETLRARYTEYKGNGENLEAKLKKKESDPVLHNMDYDYSNRRRLSTPSSSPTREIPPNEKSDNSYTNWFKSLDRLSRKKSRKEDYKTNNEFPSNGNKRISPKNLRFFGDTDADSSDGARNSNSKQRIINQKDRIRSQSSRDLHNISEELIINPELNKRNNSHKSMVNISEMKESRMNLHKPPVSPIRRNPRQISRNKDEKARRRKHELSSVESSTEGDSSQQSQKSIVYLHAATIGDIPGPSYLRNGKRVSSREELNSNESNGRIQPHMKTLSRSFSVLAPWKPRHSHETTDIDYSQYPKVINKNGKFEKNNNSSRKENVTTLKRKAQDTRRTNNNSHQNSTLSRMSRSKENISKYPKEELSKGSTSTLYKKKERLPRENSRYNAKDKEDKKISTKSMSVESLGSNNGRTTDRKIRENSRDLSRSISMPKDSERSAGWFKINKKNHHKSEYITQRL